MSKPKETLLLNGDYSPLTTPQPRRRKLLMFIVPFTLLLCSTTFAFGLFLGLLLQPHDIRVFVPQASIKEFNLISNTSVHCKVETVMVFRNPNKWLSVHYKFLHATSLYEGTRFGSVRLRKFHQGGNSCKSVGLVVEGKAKALPMNWRVEEFYRVKELGFVDHVEVWGETRMKYKIGSFTVKKRFAHVKCSLNGVSLVTSYNDRKFGGFRGVRCAIY